MPNSSQETKTTRSGVGKASGGAFLPRQTASSLTYRFDKFNFKPSNAVEEKAMKGTEPLLNPFMPVVGAGLIISGLRADSRSL
jgi:hypothetical protein